MNVEKVEFKALDGITLRGNLYLAKNRGPAIILGAGSNCVKEMFITTVAKQFQKQNITALVYDARTLGESDGFPRNDFDPAKLVEDYSDALTFLSRNDVVDSSQIGFGGMSFTGPIALAASALDSRVSFVIACCPWIDYFAKESISQLYAAATQDRISRLSGNEPSLVPVWTKEGSPVFDVPDSEGRKAYGLVLAAMQSAPRYQNCVTPQTLASLARWSLEPYIEHGITAPTLVMVPELDEVSPAEQQRKLFDQIKGPKRLHFARGRDHLGLLTGPDMQRRQKLQVDFIRDAINGKIPSKL